MKFSIDSNLLQDQGAREIPKPASKVKPTLKHKIMSFRRKGSNTDSSANSSTPPSNVSESNAPSTNASSGTLAVSTSVQQGLEHQEVLAAGALQDQESKRIQGQATIKKKIQWTKTQRKAFLKHLDQLESSNNTLESIVTMQALLNIHESVVTHPLKEDVPPETVETEKSLRRLHFALIASNKATTEEGSLRVGIRIMEPAAYAKRKKQLLLDHDYVAWSQEPSIYPLQLENSAARSSKMVLVDSGPPNPKPEQTATADYDTSLSSMLCELDPDADESFKIIGNIGSPTESGHFLRLYQDLSLAWHRQTTLLYILDNTRKSDSFIDLAVHIALSYVYLVFLGTGISYPRLGDYRYYDAPEGTHSAGSASDHKPQLTPEVGVLNYLLPSSKSVAQIDHVVTGSPRLLNLCIPCLATLEANADTGIASTTANPGALFVCQLRLETPKEKHPRYWRLH